MTRLSLAAVAAYCSYSICRTPLLPLFAHELGAGPSLIGLVMGASTVTGIFLKLPAGALSDHFGRRRLLFAGALVFATLPFTYLAVSTLGLLIALRFLHGSATAIFGPVASATLSDMAPPAQRGRWLSMYSTAQGTGQAIGPVIAGYFIAASRYDLAFIISGVVGLSVPIIISGLQQDAVSSKKRVSWPEFKAGVAQVMSNPLVLATSSMQAAQFVLNGALAAFLPLYGRDVLGLSITELGWLFGAQTITTLSVRPLIGALSDRAGRRWVMVTGLSICTIAVWSLSLVSSALAVTAVVIVYAAGVATTTAATSAFITDITHRARYGAAHGVFGTIYDIGDALGPISAGVLVASLGYERMFQAISTVSALAVLMFVAVSMHRDPLTTAT